MAYGWYHENRRGIRLDTNHSSCSSTNYYKTFPRCPSDHPAIGSIVLNMAANMLGLGNAATPMGLKAMKEFKN